MDSCNDLCIWRILRLNLSLQLYLFATQKVFILFHFEKEICFVVSRVKIEWYLSSNKWGKTSRETFNCGFFISLDLTTLKSAKVKLSLCFRCGGNKNDCEIASIFPNWAFQISHVSSILSCSQSYRVLIKPTRPYFSKHKLQESC